VGTHQIQQGSLGAGSNYALTYVPADLTITPAYSAGTVISSANPALPGSNIRFTATVSAVPPASGTMTGTVQFVIDGLPSGTPVALVGGVASIDVATLAHGSHTVAAAYAGDGNFRGCTNSLSPDQIINTPPAAVVDTLGAVVNTPANVPTLQVLTNDIDADGDLLNVTNVSATSAQGGTLLLSGATITYTPPTNYVGTDSFTYTVGDAFGGTGTGTASVIVHSLADVVQRVIRMAALPGGNVTLTFGGIPGQSYLVQATTNLTAGLWSTIGTNEANADAWFLFIDSDTGQHPHRFYRSVTP